MNRRRVHLYFFTSESAANAQHRRRCLHFISLKPFSDVACCHLSRIVNLGGKFEAVRRAKQVETTNFSRIYLRLLPIKYPFFSRTYNNEKDPRFGGDVVAR